MVPNNLLAVVDRTGMGMWRGMGMCVLLLLTSLWIMWLRNQHCHQCTHHHILETLYDNSVGNAPMTKLPSLYLSKCILYTPLLLSTPHYLCSYLCFKVYSQLGVRSSPSVLSMWPTKIFLTSKFHYLLFFCNPHPSNWTRGVQIYVGTTDSKPPGLIIMIDQSKTGISSQIVFITLFFCSSRCTVLLRLLLKLIYHEDFILSWHSLNVNTVYYCQELRIEQSEGEEREMERKSCHV
jgi:hypothetical protein